MPTPLIAANGVRACDCRSALEYGKSIAEFAARNARSIDRPDGFPETEFKRLATYGLLAAPLPKELGGLGLATAPDGMHAGLELLSWLGRGSVGVGRCWAATDHLPALPRHRRPIRRRSPISSRDQARGCDPAPLRTG